MYFHLIFAFFILHFLFLLLYFYFLLYLFLFTLKFSYKKIFLSNFRISPEKFSFREKAKKNWQKIFISIFLLIKILIFLLKEFFYWKISMKSKLYLKRKFYFISNLVFLLKKFILCKKLQFLLETFFWRKFKTVEIENFQVLWKD